ncbi:MAG: hypothetical protein WD770_01400 [Actinomycetota bacterium]
MRGGYLAAGVGSTVGAPAGGCLGGWLGWASGYDVSSGGWLDFHDGAVVGLVVGLWIGTAAGVGVALALRHYRHGIATAALAGIALPIVTVAGYWTTLLALVDGLVFALPALAALAARLRTAPRPPQEAAA